MRALLIDDEARRKVGAVVSYAMDHPYHPGHSVPGDNPNYVAQLNEYKAVFTFTHIGGRVLRHLSISVPKEGNYPNPIAAFMIAELFGFTNYDQGHPDVPGVDWAINVNKKENCVIIAQEI